MLIKHLLITYCCRASARQLTKLDIPVSYEISESRSILSPELYIVEISICVCGFVEMTDFRGTRYFFDEYGGAEYNKFRQVVFASISFSKCSSGDVSKTELGENSSGKYEGKLDFFFVSANAYQGGEYFSIESRGKQCAFMNLSASLAAESNVYR